MPTLGEHLSTFATQAPVAPTGPVMPSRLPGGRLVRGAEAVPQAAPKAGPPRRGLIAAGWNPSHAALAAPPVKGGAFNHVPTPAPVPGGVPAPASLPAIPKPPVVPNVSSRAEAGRRAPKVLTLYPNVFADTWNEKPSGPVEIGLRLVAEKDLDEARAQASRWAFANHPEPRDVDARTEAANESLMQWVVARAMCKPDDVRQGFWQTPQDTVAMAFTDDGLKYLFHEVMNLKIEESPLQPEAKVADLVMLRQLLEIQEVPNVIIDKSSPRLRRHLAWIVEEITFLVGPVTPEEPEALPSELPVGAIG